jgi:glycosyltransferase involved in cell wall biosynthesis
MKLLILTEEPYPFTLGGGTSYLRDFEEGLNYHKIDYEILAPKFTKNNKQNSKKIINLGINLFKSSSFFIRSLFKLFYYPIWAFEVLLYLLKNKKYKEFDVINSQEIIFSGTFSLILAKLFRKKVVLTAHGKFVDGLKDRVYLPIFLEYILRAYERLISSRTDKIICISREIREYYKKYNKNSIFIPNFIDLSKYHPKIRTNVKTIAYIGRLSKEKNVNLIVESAQSFPNKYFLIIGDGPEREALEKKAETLNAKNVKFLGRRDDIPKLHQKIDLVVYPWKNEPFGLVALEAMASGIPVIAADTNELHYFVGKSKSGIAIPKDKLTVEELTKAIKRFENKLFYSSCARNAIKTARDYDFKKIVGEYIQNIKSLN